MSFGDDFDNFSVKQQRIDRAARLPDHRRLQQNRNRCSSISSTMSDAPNRVNAYHLRRGLTLQHGSSSVMSLDKNPVFRMKQTTNRSSLIENKRMSQEYSAVNKEEQFTDEATSPVVGYGISRQPAPLTESSF